MTAAPGPQQPDEVEREAAAFMHLVRTLLMSYTPQGAVTWLTSRNRGLDMHRPIERWTVGYETEVQEVADLIDGGLPAAPSAQPDKLHAPGPGSSLTGYLPQCWCQEKDDVWPCPSAQPDEVRSAVTDEQGRICRCDGGAYEIKRHPFLVNTDCAIHGTPAQPVRDTEEGRR